MMRSSTFGSESHSHADQNSFVLEAYGEPLAVPSGLYNLYSSAHHHGWTRQTRAHNSVTFDGAGQIVRDAEAIGEFKGFYRDSRITYALGDASQAYGSRVKRFARSVICLDDHLYVLVDEMVPSSEAMWTWHVHAIKPMAIDSDNRCVTIRYDRAALDLTFCHADELIFREFEGWDYPPFGYSKEEDIPEEAARYHLDVTSNMPVRRDVLVTVMSPYRVGDDRAVVERIWKEGERGAIVRWGGQTYTVRAQVDLGEDRPLIGMDVSVTGDSGEMAYRIESGKSDPTGDIILIDAESVER